MISVHSPSVLQIVDLQSELYRKKTEFSALKAASSTAQTTQKKLHEILKQGTDDFPQVKKQNKPLPQKSDEARNETSPPDEDSLSLSKSRLIEKAYIFPLFINKSSI